MVLFHLIGYRPIAEECQGRTSSRDKGRDYERKWLTGSLPGSCSVTIFILTRYFHEDGTMQNGLSCPISVNNQEHVIQVF